MVEDAGSVDSGVECSDDAVKAFGALVLGDDAVQARLGAIRDTEDYIAAATALAAEHGIALDPASVRAATRAEPLGLSAFTPSPVTLDRWPARGWLPARVVHTGGAPAFDWAWFGSASLTAPFYEQTVQDVAARPFSTMFRTRTPLDAVVRDAESANAPMPAGFVHHMSRCGSTLVAQMLAADRNNVVVSEPDPLDAVVRWALQAQAPLADQIAALRAICAALGRDRSGTTRRVFFKLESWHVLALPLFRAAFPETPWVYLYRDPVEVLVSQARHRSTHVVAGLLPVGVIDIPDAERMAPDDYAARVLARTGQAVLDHWHLGGGLLVDHAEMPAAIIERIAPHFGVVPDAAGRAAMERVATRSAKAPDRPFTPDSAAKRQAATAPIRAAARSLGDPIHARLTALRDRTMASL